MKIILATTSKYRIAAFRFLKIPFEVQGSNIDESMVNRKNPHHLVKELAKLKAEAVAPKYLRAIVLGFDSVGYFNGEILEKPKSREEAFERLKELSNKMHEFFTGVYAINTVSKRAISSVVVTKVTIRRLTDDDINIYLDTSDNYKSMAVGFSALDHYSVSYVTKLVGSANNLIHGIPLEMIPEMLTKLGFCVGM